MKQACSALPKLILRVNLCRSADRDYSWAGSSLDLCSSQKGRWRRQIHEGQPIQGLASHSFCWQFVAAEDSWHNWCWTHRRSVFSPHWDFCNFITPWTASVEPCWDTNALNVEQSSHVAMSTNYSDAGCFSILIAAWAKQGPVFKQWACCRYARMLSEGHKMNIVYYDPYPNKFLEEYIRDYSKLVESKGEEPITITKLETVDEVLQAADVRPSKIPSCLSEDLHAWFKLRPPDNAQGVSYWLLTSYEENEYALMGKKSLCKAAIGNQQWIAILEWTQGVQLVIGSDYIRMIQRILTMQNFEIWAYSHELLHWSYSKDPSSSVIVPQPWLFME